MDDQALPARVELVNLFCRVTPAQKNRVILWLIACSLTVVAVALPLPFTPAGAYLGFVAPPALFFLVLTTMLLAYLLAVEGMQRWFFRRFAAE